MIGLRNMQLFALSLGAAAALSACGGSSTGGGITGGSAPTAVTSKGAIQQFGSVFVNGVEFKTKGATLLLPDDATTTQRVLQTETEIVDNKLLKLGMVVTVKGTVDANGTTGSASEVEFRNNLKAQIDDKGIDPVTGAATITVLGQTILLDDKIKGLHDSLSLHDIVEISGLPDDKGHLRATYIEKKSAEIEFEVKGFVSNASGNTFTLKLDPSAATGITVTLPAGAPLPANGSFIEVRADLTATGAAITARTVHLEDEHLKLGDDAPGQVSLEGFPSSGTVDAFTLNGQSVATTAKTLFVGGTKADFALTRKIQAEGTLSGGVLTASKIAFHATAALQSSPGLSSGQVEKFGSVFVNGVEFKTQGAVLHLRDSKTDHVLQTETELQGFLKQGMVVTVKGTFDDNGSTGTAREIEFRHQMEARIDDKGVDFIVVLGRKVVLDDSIKASLATLAVGDNVGISGIPDDKGGLRATFIEKKMGQIDDFEVKGHVSSLTGNTFTLLLSPDASAGITVTLGAGVTLPAGVANGSFVEVKTRSTGAAVTATRVKTEDRFEAAENEKLESEGFISKGTADDFFVKGMEVQISASTVFLGGVKADFAIGKKVEVEGRIVGGILKAGKVVFK